MVLGKNINFKMVILIFSNIHCRVTLELPNRGNSNVYLPYITINVFSINEKFTISFFFKTKYSIPKIVNNASKDMQRMTQADDTCQLHFCVSAKILYLQRSSADKLYNLAFPHCDKVFLAKI